MNDRGERSDLRVAVQFANRRWIVALGKCVAIQGASVAVERRFDIVRHLMKRAATLGIVKDEGIQLS